MRSTRRRDPGRASRESGSAFLIVLILLIVLTFLGLSLSVVTDTEMQLGANEKVINRLSYAADSGTAAGLGKLLLSNSWAGEAFVAPETAQFNRTLGMRVATSRVTAYDFGPAPWSNSNVADKNYYTFGTRIRSRAQRLNWPTARSNESLFDCGGTLTCDFATDPALTVQGEQRVEAAFLLSPLESPSHLCELIGENPCGEDATGVVVP